MRSILSLLLCTYFFANCQSYSDPNNPLVGRWKEIDVLIDDKHQPIDSIEYLLQFMPDSSFHQKITLTTLSSEIKGKYSVEKFPIDTALTLNPKWMYMQNDKQKVENTINSENKYDTKIIEAGETRSGKNDFDALMYAKDVSQPYSIRLIGEEELVLRRRVKHEIHQYIFQRY